MRTLSDPMHRRLAATRAAAAASRSAPREPVPSEPLHRAPVVTVAPAAPPKGEKASALERDLIDILLRPADQTLTVREAYARKEQAIFDTIAAAPFIEVWTLHKRLSIGRADDQLVVALQRLSPERRAKIMAFMADARRREALRAS